MLKLFSYFKVIDEFVFRLINDWLASPTHQKVADSFNTMDLKLQKAINRFFSFLVLLAPLLCIILLINTNAQLKKHLTQRESIIKKISTFNHSIQEFNLLSRTVVSPRPVEDKAQFIALINKVLNAKRIKLSSVTVLDFNPTTIGENLNEAKVKISFKEFSNTDFSNFFKMIMQKERMKIAEILIIKDKVSKLLGGEIFINHYSHIKKMDR